MTKWVKFLLIANVILFFVQNTMAGFTEMFMLVPGAMFVRPWTIVTYMFLHAGITHIAFNMLGLYFFGPNVEARLGSNRFITLYMIGGVSGALLSWVFAPHAAVIGA